MGPRDPRSSALSKEVESVESQSGYTSSAPISGLSPNGKGKASQARGLEPYRREGKDGSRKPDQMVYCAAKQLGRQEERRGREGKKEETEERYLSQPTN